jgi:hypothetical protein
VRPWECGDLDLIDFAICIDSIDAQRELEVKLATFGR